MVKKRVAIALSHLPHRICGADFPIRQTERAVEQIARFGGVLVGSFGAVHWDLQLALAAKYAVPVELILLPEVPEGFVESQFENLIISNLIRAKSPLERDQLVMNSVDQIYPIWCRLGGTMNRLLKDVVPSIIDRSFECSDFKFHGNCKAELPDMADSLAMIPENYLWHWTRTCDEPWPNETVGEYCSDLICHDSYFHTALNTLRRIIDSRMIIGSGKSIRAKEPVVSFTENHPSQMVDHFVWRMGRHRMNFEPYAIGFPREILESRGVVPVRYGEKGSWDSMEKADQWISEQEWRFRGDFEFSDLLKQMVVIVRDESELTGLSSFTIACFCRVGSNPI